MDALKAVLTITALMTASACEAEPSWEDDVALRGGNAEPSAVIIEPSGGLGGCSCPTCATWYEQEDDTAAVILGPKMAGLLYGKSRIEVRVRGIHSSPLLYVFSEERFEFDGEARVGWFDKSELVRPHVGLDPLEAAALDAEPLDAEPLDANAADPESLDSSALAPWAPHGPRVEVVIAGPWGGRVRSFAELCDPSTTAAWK